MTPDTEQTTRGFLDALVGGNAAAFDAVLEEDAVMRIARWDGTEVYRGRARIAQRLAQERSAWHDPVLEVLSVLNGDDRAAVEFRIQATEDRRYVEHNRSAFLTINNGRIQSADLYCPEPIPSARRKNWIAPATLTEDEIGRLFESLEFNFDIREWIPPHISGQINRRMSYHGTYDPHPGSNWVSGVRWTPEEADARIEQIISHFREHNAGFTWSVGKFDTPGDLCDRLQRHGLVLAGDQAVMARVGLDDVSDIPINPQIEIEVVDGSKAESIEAGVHIRAVCFNWTPEQTAERRLGMLERMKDSRVYESEVFYLGRLNGEPVADAHLVLRGGVAYLGGACTLREYRNRKIYSTLLRRRLQDAQERGYQIAAIHAEPMSRRVVSRYRFKEFARAYLYGWMPVMNPEVVRSLVPDE